jgi:hypothetical protein
MKRRRRLDPRRAKINRSYEVEEAARVVGAHRNTVRSWLRAGLKPIDNRRPTLIRGEELRRFLSERSAKRKRATPPGMIYCLRCREPRRPALDMAEYVPLAPMFGNLQGLCPVCEAMLFRRVNLAKLQAVSAGLDVTVRPADPRISKREEPCLNHDSGPPALTHAQIQR